MAAAGAVVAAAAARQREDEEMTAYSQDDLNGGWEFKILRSASSKFRDPVFLRAALDEEARSGWTILEKFDDTRIRLKRPVSARANDAKSPFDPYRTWVGRGPGAQAAIVLAAIFGAMAVVLALIFAAVFYFGGPPR